MSSRRQKLLPRVNWWIHSSLNTLLNKSQVIDFIMEVVVTDRFHCTSKRSQCWSPGWRVLLKTELASTCQQWHFKVSDKAAACHVPRRVTNTTLKAKHTPWQTLQAITCVISRPTFQCTTGLRYNTVQYYIAWNVCQWLQRKLTTVKMTTSGAARGETLVKLHFLFQHLQNRREKHHIKYIFPNITLQNQRSTK